MFMTFYDLSMQNNTEHMAPYPTDQATELYPQNTRWLALHMCVSISLYISNKNQ